MGAIPDGQLTPKPFVTGTDLIALGVPEGKRLGRILKTIYDAQLNGEVASLEEARALYPLVMATPVRKIKTHLITSINEPAGGIFPVPVETST